MADEPKSAALFRPACDRCGQTCATVELIPPHTLPSSWNDWTAQRQALFNQHRKVGEFYLLYEGPAGSNGWVGDPIDTGRADRIRQAFTSPSTASLAHAGLDDNAGFCNSCQRFYCAKHWNISTSGGGRCPRGHFQSLDSFWYPEE